uniref:RloB domain-containing protein n=1 Tax=Strongyloides venezuelensis TaxID=75913 RepID=A0A0K0F229_STRVS
MCMPPKRINVKEYQLFPEDKFELSLNHYSDLNLNSQIIKRIFEMSNTCAPSVDMCKIYHCLKEENKHDIRISKKHDLNVFLQYFPLVLDSVIKQNTHEIQRGRPKVVFVCNSSDEALKVYSMVEEFVKGFKVRAILSRDNIKMKFNTDGMKAPYTILVTTLRNLLHHLEHPLVYLSDCSHFIMVDISTWKEENNYLILASLMITSGWDPKNKCSVIGISEMFGCASRNIFNYFSYKNYYDIGF